MPNWLTKLGLKDMNSASKTKFTRMEDNLQDEDRPSWNLLDEVTKELKDKRLKVTPELQKTWDFLEKVVADREDKATDRLVSPG